MPVKTAVVILNWNGKKLLELFLPGVVANSKDDANIYVADNCSTDESVSFLENHFPDVRIILNDRNYGFAGGYNECLKKIEADYFILLNSDVEVTPGWINPVITLMEQDKMIAACQPRIRSYHQKNFFEYAGASGGFIDHFGYPFCRGRIFNTLEQDTGQYADAIEIFWASGACMFVRSSVYRMLHGFDETFFAHMEEIDLCWRMQRNGFRIMVNPASVVFHVGGGTLPRSNPHKTFLTFRNNLLMIHKNLPASRLTLVIPFRLMLDGIAGIKFFINGNPLDCLAVIRAHFYFYWNFIERITIRKASRPLVKEHLVKNIYRRSIVFEYFIMGIRKFSKLCKNYF